MMWTHFSHCIYIEYELKTLSIILMCFDGKNNHLKTMQEKVQQY